MRASYVTHYLGVFTQYINNFEPRANFQITPTDSEINPWSPDSFNFAFKLLPPRSVSHIQHKTDTVNTQASLCAIKFLVSEFVKQINFVLYFTY